MRPLPGEARSRSTSFTDNDAATPLAARSQLPQMTYFIADEKTMEEGRSPSPPGVTKPQHSPKSSTYGVESLETTLSSMPADNSESLSEEKLLRHARHNWKKNLGKRLSDEDLSSVASLSVSGKSEDLSRNASPCHPQPSSQATISRPFTPLSFGSPAIGPSSPTSRRDSDAGSDMDEVASQAIASSGDEERDVSEMVDSGSAPQLIMPSIKMPSRRPFTERGKHMGRFKVLIAGDSGVGKTSLIKAIVQICEDIVHVDSLSPTPISISDMRRKSSRSKHDVQSTCQITEVYASTKAYPAWWSDLEESRILRRRKSLGDSVLERNLCFVDTPGYANKTSCLECITPVVDYVESHFKKATNLERLSEPDIISMMSGNGGSQVDLVLYMITQKVKPVDIEYLRRLSHLTNIIPLVAQAEALSPEDISFLKQNIFSELESASIRSFHFGPPAGGPSISPPYAISTTPSKDHDTMDASLLMSPDYVSPLMPSELSTLVSQIFEPSNISWLRHSAAKKFVMWRASSTPTNSIPRSLSSPAASVQSLSESNSYALARITDHTQREERIAQIRLANWAADLQRSMHNERMQFSTLAHNERAVWLTQKLEECSQEESLLTSSPSLSSSQSASFGNSNEGALVKREQQGTYSRRTSKSKPFRDPSSLSSRKSGVDRHDPLGLLVLEKEMKRRGVLAVKMLGGLGVLGGLVYWAFRTWMGDEEVQIWGVGVRDWLDIGTGLR